MPAVRAYWFKLPAAFRASFRENGFGIWTTFFAAFGAALDIRNTRQAKAATPAAFVAGWYPWPNIHRTEQRFAGEEADGGGGGEQIGDALFGTGLILDADA